MERHRVAIVIPALNESSSIAAVVEAAGEYGLPIVVDDGSTDATAEIAGKAGATVVSHPFNCGYDKALNSGFKKAAELKAEILITVDADGQHNPALIQKFIDDIDAGSDVAVGIRSKRQRLSEHLFALYAGLRFGMKDPLCGMKAYRREVYEALGHFDSYGSIGTELAIFAASNGFRMSQIPFEVREREGVSRFGQVLSGNYKILRAMMLAFWSIKRLE